MKLFEDVKVERVEVQAPVIDNSVYIKRNLLKGVNRSEAVIQAIEGWLMSFTGAISKEVFQHQMKRLDWDDSKALSQLKLATDRKSRVIPLTPPEKKPKLAQSLIAQMAEDTYVAIYGRKFKKAVKEVVSQLRDCGDVYVLEIEQLILNFKSYEDKGQAPQMIDRAVNCDFLVIVDLEMPIHLEWHIREAIERIGRLREASKKPIISTWCRFNDCNAFFERFKVYVVE